MIAILKRPPMHTASLDTENLQLSKGSRVTLIYEYVFDLVSLVRGNSSHVMNNTLETHSLHPLMSLRIGCDGLSKRVAARRVGLGSEIRHFSEVPSESSGPKSPGSHLFS